MITFAHHFQPAEQLDPQDDNRGPSPHFSFNTAFLTLVVSMNVARSTIFSPLAWLIHSIHKHTQPTIPLFALTKGQRSKRQLQYLIGK